jgi:hypothetical protein
LTHATVEIELFDCADRAVHNHEHGDHAH